MVALATIPYKSKLEFLAKLLVTIKHANPALFENNIMLKHAYPLA
jgi:hypothetical protein